MEYEVAIDFEMIFLKCTNSGVSAVELNHPSNLI